MELSISDWKDIAQTFQSFAAPIGLALGGLWAYNKYVRMGERYPHIQSAAEIEIIGEQNGFLVVELRAILENRGKVEHKISDFGFELKGVSENDALATSEKWGGQADFPHVLAKGSFLPKNFSYFAIGPTVTAEYSYVALVPISIAFLMIHCWFTYSDDRKYHHSMEKTVKVSREVVEKQKVDS